MATGPFGTWESPLSASIIAAGSITFADLDTDGKNLYFSETRPTEKGRTAIVRYSADNEFQTVLPEPYSARTRVHEYGGTSITVVDGTIYFVNYADQNLYQLLSNGDITQITTDGTRFAELTMTPYGIVAVAEQQTENFLALIDIDTGNIKKLATGHDFYAAPAIHGDKIVWITWDHPNMPWNDTQLWLADFVAGEIKNPQTIRPNDKPQSFFQPGWDKDGNLIFVSDWNNWWNLYRYDLKTKKFSKIFPLDAEFGRPLWVLGNHTWCLYQDKIISVFSQAGHVKLALNDKVVDIEYSELHSLMVHKDKLYFFAATPTTSMALREYDLKTGLEKIIKLSCDVVLDNEFISVAEHIEYPTPSKHKIAFGYLYLPKNPSYKEVGLPPLIVFTHGGPTAASSGSFSLKIQYWTTRGFAVADVNYGGSTGYGRAYRQALDRESPAQPGNWGIVDIQDCVACVDYLVKQCLVDENRIFIRGGSAGGYTTLAALTFTDKFKGGASYYGISDMYAMAHDTHKFEAKYLDVLVGELPEFKQVYDDRSPINHLDKFNSAVILFQGDEDKIVLPNQAEMIFTELQAREIPVEYILYAGEQHGFRKAETIVDSLTKELDFYLRSSDAI